MKNKLIFKTGQSETCIFELLQTEFKPNIAIKLSTKFLNLIVEYNATVTVNDFDKKFLFFGISIHITDAIQNAIKSLFNFLKRLETKFLKQNLLLSTFESKKIFKAVKKQWVELSKHEDTSFKVLAAFVITNDNDSNDIQVISVGTGNKCVAGESIRFDRYVVHDSHAEVVARRALKCFLYENLSLISRTSETEYNKKIILEKMPNSKGYRLKTNLKLHLFITSPPCGDARLFQLAEVSMYLIQFSQ